MIEFNDQDNEVFDEIMRALQRHPAFERMTVNDNTVLSIPGLDIYPERRKIFCNGQEILLTVKEYDLLYLLSTNSGKVMTYEQMYQNVWKDFAQNIRNSTISYHVNNLKKKISAVLPSALFEIRCVREVGYCLEVYSE